jgi:hypothetical protein
MRAVGVLVTGAIHDIHVEIPLIVAEGDLVADRVEAAGVRADTGAPLPGWRPCLPRSRGPGHRAMAGRRLG